MANMLLLVLTLALMSCAQSQDHYHYPRPQIPFQLTPQYPVQRPLPPAKFIVQTYGPNGHTYELQTHQAPAVYVAHQTHLVPGVQNQQQHQNQAPHQVQVQVQPQQQQHHHLQQHQQFPPSSQHTNPLLLNTNSYPQATTVGLEPPPPPPPPNNYYVPPPPQPQEQNQAQAALQQSADSYYRQPQALTAEQPTANYGPPQQQQQLQSYQEQPQSYSNNPQPYAVVTLPNGQRVQDAGHGSGPLPNEVTVAPPRVGDYVAQSQGATLDTYSYKQTIPGDTRAYQRHVSNCLPNGQCQQLNLNPGQIDGNHYQLVQAARAQTQPAKTNCRKDDYVTPGAEQNAQRQLRPKNRRTYANVQEQVAKYPYN